MTLVFSAAVLAAGSSAIGATVGPGATLKCWTNANDGGRPILNFPLSTVWGAVLSSGVYDLNQLPLLAGAYSPGGFVNAFALLDANGVTHVSGSIGPYGVAADWNFDNNFVGPGQTVRIIQWTLSTGFAMQMQALNTVNTFPATPQVLAAITKAGSRVQTQLNSISTASGKVISVNLLEGFRGFIPVQIST